MIRAISTLLEASFRPDEKGTVTIKKELEYVECYLLIQKERFGSRLQYKVNVEDAALLLQMVPKLCLEPIVENAVIHGIEPKIGSGMVRIDILHREKNILMIVKDNGVGFQKPQTERKKGGSSVGVKNTDRRLKLIYGDEYGVFIDESETEGAKVIIKVPYTGGESYV